MPKFTYLFWQQNALVNIFKNNIQFFILFYKKCVITLARLLRYLILINKLENVLIELIISSLFQKMH